MGLLSKWVNGDSRDHNDITVAYGLIGTDGYYDAVTGEHDIDWVVVDIQVAKDLLEGKGESRGYKIVNGIYYLMVYLPPAPHLREYEE